MAHHIFPHYSLCPLIEEESFLGLRKDIDDDTAVVTVNANIIGRYKISDPKLLSSWNSKGRITSACIYDAVKERYIAIFNDNELRIWATTDENIDKVKKYRFAEKLYKLLICQQTEKVILVFRKGNVFYLDDVLEHRKNTFENHYFSSKDEILSCDAYVSPGPTVIFVIEDENSTHRVISVSLESKELLFDVTLRNPDSATLLGRCLFVDKDVYLLTLWSNGKLYRDVVREKSEILVKNQLATLENVNLNRKVIMKVLSPYYIAICGAKDDGILLIIYSIQYNLIQCEQFYENCQTVSQLWNFDSKLFLIIGHNLIVTPYAQENRKLSSLLGSGILQLRVQQPDCIDILPESEICKSTVPLMLENEDIEGISKLLDDHTDIPDSVLLDILFWSLQNERRKRELLDQILNSYVISDSFHLRKIFDIDTALIVLDYIMTNLSKSNVVTKLVKWASMFVDAFYPQLIMSKDVAIVGKLRSYIEILRQECNYLNNYKELNSVMSCLERKKVISS